MNDFFLYFSLSKEYSIMMALTMHLTNLKLTLSVSE